MCEENKMKNNKYTKGNCIKHNPFALIKNDTNGITLTVLVITIIVLLILSGITITALSGDNGIASRARKIADSTANSQNSIEQKLGNLENKLGETILGNVVGTREDWEVSEDGTLRLYKGSIPEDGILVIPNIVDGIKITKVEPPRESSGGRFSLIYRANEFQASNGSVYNSSIKKVIISEGITFLGERAFAKSSALVDVVLPNSLKEISTEAFWNCISLKSITIPNSVTNIGNYAFYGCTSLASIEIPNSVRKIENSAFNGCNNLTTVNYLGTKAQWNAVVIGNYNDALKNAKINCIEYIGPLTSKMKEIMEQEETLSAKTYGAREDWNVSSDGTLGLYKGTISEDGTMIIPVSVDNINITKIELSLDERTQVSTGTSNNIGNIFYRANEYQVDKIYNSSVKKVIIPTGVQSLGWGCFGRSSALVSISLPSSITEIGYDIFTGCDNLTTVNFRGTKTQWDSIKGRECLSGKTLYCTDGIYYI